MKWLIWSSGVAEVFTLVLLNTVVVVPSANFVGRRMSWRR